MSMSSVLNLPGDTALLRGEEGLWACPYKTDGVAGNRHIGLEASRAPFLVRPAWLFVQLEKKSVLCCHVGRANSNSN